MFRVLLQVQLETLEQQEDLVIKATQETWVLQASVVRLEPRVTVARLGLVAGMGRMEDQVSDIISCAHA